MDALYPIFCDGRDRHGRRCRRLIAKLEGGVVVHRHHGWAIHNPRSIRCSCGTERVFIPIGDARHALDLELTVMAS